MKENERNKNQSFAVPKTEKPGNQMNEMEDKNEYFSYQLRKLFVKIPAD